jgi:L-ascorbate metabolism protein UlaG (beta-lactamase superfamily)
MRELAVFVWAVCAVAPGGAQKAYESDTFDLDGGTLKITFLGHGTLMMEYAGSVIHVDPVSQEADYAELPQADLILVTHNHSDHLDPAAIRAAGKPGATVILNPTSAKQLGSGIALANGERRSVGAVTVEAVAAYNTTAGRDRFHPKGRDNGYLITIAGKTIYIAGDTEETPEMRALRGVWMAFLPMNQPYTMTPAQAASAAKAFRPQILYPYHFGDTKVEELRELLAGEKGIDVRLRRMS